MNSSVRKTLREIQRRDKVKNEALQKGWRSRWTLLLKAWSGADRGSHLEWLGFYQEADEVRAKYKFGIKEMAELTVGAATMMGNSMLHDGVTDSLNNTVTYGHIDNSRGTSALYRTIASMFYLVKEQILIIFGKYKTDAFGLPVCWFKPKNVGSSVNGNRNPVNGNRNPVNGTINPMNTVNNPNNYPSQNQP